MHIVDELGSGPLEWSTAEVDQPCDEIEAYGRGIEASTSSGNMNSSNGLVVSTLTNGSSRRRLPSGGAAEPGAESSTLTYALPLLM